MQLQPEIPQAEEPVIPANWRRYEGQIPAYCCGNTTIYVDCQDPQWRQWDGAKRYTVRGSGSELLTTDDWDAVLALVEQRAKADVYWTFKRRFLARPVPGICRGNTSPRRGKPRHKPAGIACRSRVLQTHGLSGPGA
jgi:hypothetical protein